MIAELNGVVQSVRVLADLIQANKSFRNFNELVSAVAEVNAKLLTSQSVAMTSQEKQATLTQRIGELEKEITELKDWNREAECYELTEIALGTFAYRSKPGVKQNEPTHLLCTDCFTQGQKSILQRTRVEHILYCPRCKTEFHVVPSSAFRGRQGELRPSETPFLKGGS